MQSVCICGSFRFYEEMVQLRNTLQARGVRCEWPLPGPRRDPHAMTADEARDAITRHLERMDRAACIFVFNKDGYLGNSVVMAIDGHRGISAAEEEAPDLILMDMNLPEIDGWEATRRLKSQEATRHVPVIALTAHAMVSDRQKALEAGCDDYEAKPLEFQRLLSKIQAILERENARAGRI